MKLSKAAEPKGRQAGVVAIGASAGGIGALQGLLARLPRDFGAPVLVVLHLDPAHPSNVAQLLQRSCKLIVNEAREGEPLRPGHVYLGKPDRHLEVLKGQIHLTRTPRVRFARPSVDRLFESVAKEFGENAVAVVLSGSGFDGSEGIVKVKEAEGTTVAEDRATAAYPSMPEAAARTGAVDIVLRVEKIAEFLVRAVEAGPGTIPTTTWQILLRRLRARFGTDFGGYKVSTLRRRLEKRLLATHSQDLGAYLRLVDQDPAELQVLYASFLIKVSSFFRDPDAWRVVRDSVVKPLVRNPGKGAEIRVWAAGCATGEEAYSLAMLFMDAFGGTAPGNLKIFATDIDEGALETARRGRYQAAQLAAVSPAHRKRYFVEDGAVYRVRKEVRTCVIFGKHDLLRDPPIAQLDLLVCRNVLIYLGEEQKNAILARFGYALKPAGFLFLGKAEIPSTLGGMVTPVSGRSHVYQRVAARYSGRRHRPNPPRAPASQSLAQAVDQGGRNLREEVMFQHMLVQSTSVLLVLVDTQRRITLWNRAAEEFFALKAREALNRPLEAIFGGAAADRVRKALRRAVTESSPTVLADLACPSESGPERHIDLDLIPLGPNSGHGGALLVGVDTTRQHEDQAKLREAAKHLRKAMAESARMNETLQASNEELETLNEELQSSAEEQQTLNEELQSANEELETTNEELQSANEELTTLNEEIRTRSEELGRISSFLRAILDTGLDAVIACDRQNKITFWSRTAAKWFRLSDAQAVGEDLFSLVPALDQPPVRAAIRETLSTMQRVLVGPIEAPERKLVASISAVSDRMRGAFGYVLAANVPAAAAAVESPGNGTPRAKAKKGRRAPPA